MRIYFKERRNQVDRIFKVLGDVNRLRILNLLFNTDELCVCEIEVILDMTQSNVSRNLGRLKNVGLVNSTKEAQWVIYKLDSDFIKKNDSLIKFLKGNFESDDLYQKDREIYLRYKNSNFNCQSITDDKNNVLKTLYKG